MTFSSNPNTYQDVRKVLDHAVAHGDLKLRFPSHARARYFAQRCYAFIRVFRRHHEARFVDYPGVLPPTPYDNLMIQKFKEHTEQEDQVHILFRESKTLAGVTDINGLPIEFDSAPEKSDPLEEEALRLAEDLNLDIE